MPCLAALLLIIACAPALGQTPHSDLSTVEREVVRLVNEARAQHHLPPVAMNEQLTAAARAQVNLIAERRQLSHRFPGQPILSERIAATGVHFDSAGENAVESSDTGDAQRDAADAEGTLMLSPEHRENILNPVYNAVGVAAASSGGHVCLVQDFARVFAPVAVTDVETRAAQAMNHVRRDHGAVPLAIVDQPGLRQLACRDDVSPAQLFRNFPRATLAFVYTVFKVDDFPADLAQQASDSTLRTAALAACSEDQKERHGSFRVAVLLFSERATAPESRSKR